MITSSRSRDFCSCRLSPVRLLETVCEQQIGLEHTDDIARRLTHDKGVPQWIGIAGIVVGALLAIGGFMQKR